MVPGGGGRSLVSRWERSGGEGHVWIFWRFFILAGSYVHGYDFCVSKNSLFPLGKSLEALSLLLIDRRFSEVRIFGASTTHPSPKMVHFFALSCLAWKNKWGKKIEGRYCNDADTMKCTDSLMVSPACSGLEYNCQH